MTREEKIEMFDKNQEYTVIMNQTIFDRKTDLEKMKNIFLKLLEKYNVNVVNAPVFLYENRTGLVRNYLFVENAIMDYFSNFEKIFIYTITEMINSEPDKKIIIRCLTIPD